MRRLHQTGVVVSAVVLAACASGGSTAPNVIAAPETPAAPAASLEAEPDPAPAPAETPSVAAETPNALETSSTVKSADATIASLEAYLAELSRVSCPAGAKRMAGEAVALTVKSTPLQALNPSRRKIGELMFVGGFHLASQDSRFGGLSGIDVLEDGNLLAVSDQGDFLWIDLDNDGVTPEAARIASMRDAGGEPLRGKAQGDAEGIAVNGDIALVSYERDHRVLAFDLGRCGAAARGAPIVLDSHGKALSAAFGEAGLAVGGNQGPEPLAVTRDWYLFTGIETKAGAESPLSARPIEAAPEFNLRIGKDAPEFVGLDLVPTGRNGQDVRAFSAHRSFSPLAGNAIVLMETRFSRELDQADLPRRRVSDIDERSHYRFRAISAKKLAELNILFNVDNFEGLAAKELPDGRIRVYLISDDNFSKTQRTLFFVFETLS